LGDVVATFGGDFLPGFDAEKGVGACGRNGNVQQMLFRVAVDYKALECTV